MSITGKSRLDLALCGGLTVIAYVLWVSAASLWIDEGNAALKAVQRSLAAWYDTLQTSGGSDAQMPGFMLYGWLWEKLFGRSEFGLRASNLPWYFLALWCLRGKRWELLALGLSPFVLYYVNEFRPYMMQIAGGAVAASGLRMLGRDLTVAWRQILGGCLILCAASLIGVLWAAGVVVAAVILRPDLLRTKMVWRDSAVVSLAFAGMGWYYLRSLLMGQGAAALSGGLLMSVGACVYELMGLLGLGPGKGELRVNPASVRDYVMPLAVAATLVSGTWLAGLAGVWRSISPRRGWALLAGIAIPIGALVVLLFLKDFRLLARHLAPLVVLLAMLTGNALAGSGLAGSWKKVARVCAAAAVLIGVVSALSSRFSARHHKDDYRQAAQVANAACARGRPVVWAADVPTGLYYGLRFEQAGAQGACRVWDASQPVAFAGDEMVLLSKPDLYDPQGALRGALHDAGFAVVDEMPAFTLWAVR